MAQAKLSEENIDRFVAAQNMLIGSCLGYVEGQFPIADHSKGTEGLPGLFLQNRGPDDESSTCEVRDFNDPTGEVHNTMVMLLENDRSPFELKDQFSKDTGTTRVYRHKDKRGIGLIISQSSPGTSSLDWIATVALMEWN